MSNSSLYNDIAQGLREAIAYERGEIDASAIRIVSHYADIPRWTPEEIKSLRINNSMTQRAFAKFMGVSLKTVEAWECGRNRPNGSAARLMQIISVEGRIALYTTT